MLFTSEKRAQTLFLQSMAILLVASIVITLKEGEDTKQASMYIALTE